MSAFDWNCHETFFEGRNPHPEKAQNRGKDRGKKSKGKR